MNEINHQQRTMCLEIRFCPISCYLYSKNQRVVVKCTQRHETRFLFGKITSTLMVFTIFGTWYNEDSDGAIVHIKRAVELGTIVKVSKLYAEVQGDEFLAKKGCYGITITVSFTTQQRFWCCNVCSKRAAKLYNCLNDNKVSISLWTWFQTLWILLHSSQCNKDFVIAFTKKGL